MQQKWKNLSSVHKVVSVISVVASAFVMLFAILQLLNIWDAAINVCLPLLGMVDLCQAYLQWDINRKIAYLDIGVAAFIFICSGVVFFL